MSSDVPTPMFPLSTVLFPGGVLPLHVFEPRYRAMMEHCMAGDRSFGVVLIARGWEVGGGEVRSSVGTLARIERISMLPDGRSHLLTRGTRRFRVTEWMPDDPFPVGRVEWLDDGGGPSGTEVAERFEVAAAAVRRARALLSELRDVPAMSEPDPDSELEGRAWSLCDQAPLNPFDRQQLLEMPSLSDRLEALRTLATAAANDLAALLAQG